MSQHRYSHMTPKYFCMDFCIGFIFASQLTSHRYVHLMIPGYQCFAKNCGKIYKQEAELKAHVVKYKKNTFECKICDYNTDDPRNLIQHCRYDQPLKFECVYCYKKFRYYEQKKCEQPSCEKNPGYIKNQNKE